MKKKKKCKPKCTRFRQVGKLELAAFTITIEVEGRRLRESRSAKTVWLKCIDCGAVEQREQKAAVRE